MGWDEIAQEFLASGHGKKKDYYLKKAYETATKLGIKYVDSEKIALLKADLWNEGVGCRNLLAQFEGNKNFSLFGIDLSLTVCSSAKSRSKNSHIAQADIRNLPFAKNSFDILLDISTLDHVPWLQAKKALKEYARVLKSNGVLVLVFWYNCFAVKHVRHDKENEFQYYFSLKEAKSELKQNFDVLEEYCIHCLSTVPKRLSPKKWPNWFLDLLLKLEYSWLSRFLLKEFSGLYVVIARKGDLVGKNNC